MQSMDSAFQDLFNKGHIAPELRVGIYDTTKTVPSLGFDAKYYTWNAGTNLAGDWTGSADVTEVMTGNEYSTVLAFDWGEGAPPPVSQVDNYGAVWEGWFFARYSGVYTFYIDSGEQCGVQMFFDGSKLTFMDGNDASGDTWYGGSLQESREELYAQTASLTKGQWYRIRVDFFTGSNLYGASNAYLAVKYSEPTGATTDIDEFGNALGISDYPADAHKKPLSAGVVNTTGSFLSPTYLTGLTEYSLDRQFGQVAQVSVKANLSMGAQLDRENTAPGNTSTVYVETSTSDWPSQGVLEIGNTRVPYTSKGSMSFNLASAVDVLGEDTNIVKLADTPYAFDRDTNSFGPIKMFSLATVEVGLNDGSGGTEWVSRMWGIVYPEPKSSKKVGEDSFTINIQDFGLFLQDYARNYPDNASYSAAGEYLGSGYGRGANGQTRPVCYDGWVLSSVFRDLIMKANIDPIWTYGRLKVADGATFNTSYGDYHVRGEDVYLDKKPMYGNPETSDEDEADDQYVWFIPYGETLLESITNLSKNFGYGLSMLEDGQIRFKGLDLPMETLFARDLSGSSGDAVYSANTGNWDRLVDLDTLKGVAYETSVLGESMVFTCRGRYAEVILVRDSDVSSVMFKIDGSYAVSAKYDGATHVLDSGMGDLSPSGFTSWMYYDGADPSANAVNHSIVLLDLGTFDEHTIEVRLPATGDSLKIAGLFSYASLASESSTTVTTSEIDKLDDTINLSEVRNEVIVVGTLLGLFKDNIGQTVNPLNPISKHVSSSAIDLNSLYNRAVKNYVGRRIPFEIYNPNIFSQDRADFLATAVLEKYRKLQHSPSFNLAKPNPSYQILDVVGVSDTQTNLVTASDPLWVVGINESMKAVDGASPKYQTNLKMSGHKPLLSYMVKEPPELADFSSEPVVNVEIMNSGRRICGDDGSRASVLTWQAATDPGWKADMWKGHELWVDGEWYRWLIVGNTSDTLTLHAESPYNLPTGSNKQWSISFDPFDADRGAPLEVHYDQAIGGRVEVQIYRQLDVGVEKVASINLAKSDEWEDWGSDKVVYWDGTDESRDGYLTKSRDSHYVKFIVHHTPDTSYQISTRSDLLVNSQKQLFRPRIMNAGLHIELDAEGLYRENSVIWEGNMVYQGTSGDYDYYEDIDGPEWPEDFTDKVVVVYWMNSWNSDPFRKEHVTSEISAIIQDADMVNKYLFFESGALEQSLSRFTSPSRLSGVEASYIYYRVIDPSIIYEGLDYVPLATMRSSDNDGQGLKVTIRPRQFFVSADAPRSIVGVRPTGSMAEFMSPRLHANQWQMILRCRDLAATYEGNTYQLDWPFWSADILSENWVKSQRPLLYSGVGYYFSSNDILCEDPMPVIYWNKYYPNQVRWTHMSSLTYGAATYQGGSSSHQLALQKVLSDDAFHRPVRENFPNGRGSMFPLHIAWPVNKSEEGTLDDDQLSYAHLNYYAPTKAIPKPYGKIRLSVAVSKVIALRSSDGVIYAPWPTSENYGEEEILQTDTINLNGFSMHFNPTSLVLNNADLVSFQDLVGELNTDERVIVRMRFKLEVRDAAGRLPVECRSGVLMEDRRGEFPYYNGQAIEFDILWSPESDEAYYITRDSVSFLLDDIERDSQNDTMNDFDYGNADANLYAKSIARKLKIYKLFPGIDYSG